MSLEELQKPAPGWATLSLCDSPWLSVLFQAPGHLPSTSQARALKGELGLLWLSLQLGRELDWRNLWEVRALWSVATAMPTPSRVPTNPMEPLTSFRGCHQM